MSAALVDALDRGGRLCLRSREPPLEALPAGALAPTLTSLDASANALRSLELPELPRLLELRLADNALGAAAVQRAALPPTLRVLDLGANRLVALPPRVLRLSGLAVLKVDRQRLRSLPPELSLLRLRQDVSLHGVAVPMGGTRPLSLPEGAGKAMEVLVQWERPTAAGRYEFGLRLFEGAVGGPITARAAGDLDFDGLGDLLLVEQTDGDSVLWMVRRRS